MKRLAIITTHPIQYNAPLFRLLVARGRIDIKVFYTWGQSKESVFDPGFGKARSWDIPLLDGYPSVFLDNPAKNPGSRHFWGIQNPSILKELKDYTPDAILVYGWPFWSHLRVLLYFNKKIKILFRGDSTLLNYKNVPFWKQILKKIVLGTVFKTISYALFVGSQNRLYFSKYGLNPKQLIWAPHAVDTSRFCSDITSFEFKASQFRKSLGILDHEVIFIYAGKLQLEKDLYLLIRAFKKMNSVHARLILVGNGVLEQMLKAEANDCDRILFIDFQNQQKMPEVYRWSDVVVLPSKSETWGLAINEAFACSRPAIVSDRVGCAVDLVIPGQTGWVFPSGNEEALADTLEAAVALGRSGLRRLGSQAFVHIQEWNFERVARVIEQTVNDAD